MPIDARLQEAFATRADGVRADGVALVGTFGEGVPCALVAALGGLAVDVKAPPLADAVDGPSSAVVDRVAEPFLDHFTTRFLHRFAAGAFDHFASIIFAREDVAGLAAYQYALELRRLGKIPQKGPRLYILNVLRDKSAAARDFNRTEMSRLTEHLEETLGATLHHNRLSLAIRAETERTQALDALSRGGSVAFIARNAGRWMTPVAHASGLPTLVPRDGAKIALVGTACDIPVHEFAEEHGEVVADLQDYGRSPPQPIDKDDLAGPIANDPLSVRARPPKRFTDALLAGVAEADLVIASVNRNDESFGWEMPILRQSIETRGARLLDLGFRPFRPDDVWVNDARARITEALS